jgi:DNA excision repair protein ERCC-2
LEPEKDLLANPLVSADVITEAIPGSIRKADHFIAFMRRIVVYLKNELKSREVKVISPLSFLYNLNNKIHADSKSLKY